MAKAPMCALQQRPLAAPQEEHACMAKAPMCALQQRPLAAPQEEFMHAWPAPMCALQHRPLAAHQEEAARVASHPMCFVRGMRHEAAEVPWPCGADQYCCLQQAAAAALLRPGMAVRAQVVGGASLIFSCTTTSTLHPITTSTLHFTVPHSLLQNLHTLRRPLGRHAGH